MFRFVKLFILTSFLFLTGINASSAPQTVQESISIDVPKSVIQETITQMLPLDIDTDSDNFEGTVTIADIRNLQFANDLISCQLHLIGKDVNVITKIAGTALKLRIGELELDFSTDIVAKFDQKTRKLMLTPHISEVAKSSDQADGNIGKTLVSLFNNKTFGVDLNKIKPISSQSGDKTINIKMIPVGAEVNKQGIQVDFVPKVYTKN